VIWDPSSDHEVPELGRRAQHDTDGRRIRERLIDDPWPRTRVEVADPAVRVTAMAESVPTGPAGVLPILQADAFKDEPSVVLHDRDADLARELERAGDYQGFAFRRKGEPLYLENGTVSMELAVTYRGGIWTSITVDVARAELGEAEIELVPAIALEAVVGIAGPAELPCLPLRLHVAQKLHGMTLPPRPGKRNERFRDLVDLLLLEKMVTNYVGLREACEQVFRARGTHPWPPPLEVPPHWDEPFAKLAQELELPVTDAAEAMVGVRTFVERIRAA
jgi:hypothetical protein